MAETHFPTWQSSAAVRMVEAGVAMLPAGQRERYREEMRADLDALLDKEKLGFGVRALLHAPSLRRALSGPDPSDAAASNKPLLCRLHVHHWGVVHPNPEDQRIEGRQCRRCGQLHDGVAYTPLDPNDWAWIMASQPPTGPM